MNFRLLGPLEVRVDGEIVAITSPKHRALLASLLLAAGRPVPITELADAMWGEDQPANPRAAVQVCVARLRTVFVAATGKPLIKTWGNGYAIDVAPECVDVARFESALREARQAGDLGDIDKELAALVAALAEWRGEPLADVSSEVLDQRAATGLVEQRLQAIERRIDLDLHCGRHAEVLGELRELTARHPLREPFWAQLIRTLGAHGRRSEALDAYHAVRRYLVDELGIEPGDELRRLHVRLLAGPAPDPVPTQPVPTQPVPTQPEPSVPVPRQLPSEVPGFVGRAALVGRLDALVDDGDPARVVVVAGTAGVGKTALATWWARRVADSFPDGQLWADLRGYHSGQEQPPERVLWLFLRALGVSSDRIPREREQQEAMYRTLLDGRRMLVVLDNAGSAEQVRPLLPGSPGCLAVVTSRSQLTGLVAAVGAHLLAVDLLARDEARLLLAYRLGKPRVAAQPQAADEIIDRCAHLPLALAIVAARAAAAPRFALDAIAAELSSTEDALDAFSTGNPDTDLRTVFSWSLRGLSPAAARLFRLLGLHPGPDLAAPAAASLAGVSVARARSALSELARANLLVEQAPGRYGVHDLLHAYAAELADTAEPPAERQAATLRMLDHHLRSALTVASQFAPLQVPIAVVAPVPGVKPEALASRDQAMTWFAEQNPVLLALVNLAATGGFATHAWQLAWAIHGYLLHHGGWQDLEVSQRIALDAATAAGDPCGQAHAHRCLAAVMSLFGRYDEAGRHFDRALELFTAVGDRAGQAVAQLTMAAVRGRLGQPAQALGHAERAAELYRQVEHAVGYANALNSVAWFHAKLGNHRQTLTYCRRALAQLRRAGDRRGQAGALDTLGVAHHQLGEYRQAETHFRRAARMFGDLGQRYYQADTLIHLGDTYAANGDPAAACATRRQALTLLGAMNHPDADRVRAELDR